MNARLRQFNASGRVEIVYKTSYRLPNYRADQSERDFKIPEMPLLSFSFHNDLRSANQHPRRDLGHLRTIKSPNGDPSVKLIANCGEYGGFQTISP